MARQFTESRLVFHFDNDWVVEQWDSHQAYRAADGFGALASTTACDFLGWHATDSFYLIEVKNLTEHHHANRDRLAPDALPSEVADKVRDTLAGVIWTRGRSFDAAPLADVLSKTIEAIRGRLLGRPPLQVVLWLEDRPALKPDVASVLQSELLRRLKRWFGIQRVLVTSLGRFDPNAIPGLTVRPAP